MVFCDWLSIYQIHPQGGLPVINSGRVVAVDQDGSVEWTTCKKMEHVGSYDTRLRFMCDGTRVIFEGNIGRYGRSDNVFGYSVLDCVGLASDFLEGFGLPRFTQLENNLPASRSDSYIKTGAVITRVDLTQNYVTGSPENASRLVHFMAGQQGHGREGRNAMAKAYGNTGVTWGEGSKHWYAKLYLKFLEMEKHAQPMILDWCKQVGLARHEVSLKSRYLLRHGLQDLRAWIVKEGEKMENVIYAKFGEIFERNTVQKTGLDDMPDKLRRVVLDWMSGRDIWNGSGNIRTKQRLRNALLPYGYDIKTPCDVSRLNLRVEVITMQAVSAPEWYWDMHNLKAAA